MTLAAATSALIVGTSILIYVITAVNTGAIPLWSSSVKTK